MPQELFVHFFGERILFFSLGLAMIDPPFNKIANKKVDRAFLPLSTFILALQFGTFSMKYSGSAAILKNISSFLVSTKKLLVEK